MELERMYNHDKIGQFIFQTEEQVEDIVYGCTTSKTFYYMMDYNHVVEMKKVFSSKYACLPDITFKRVNLFNFKSNMTRRRIKKWLKKKYPTISITKGIPLYITIIKQAEFE